MAALAAAESTGIGGVWPGGISSDPGEWLITWC
jgi:hypothetical protein